MLHSPSTPHSTSPSQLSTLLVESEHLRKQLPPAATRSVVDDLCFFVFLCFSSSDKEPVERWRLGAGQLLPLDVALVHQLRDLTVGDTAATLTEEIVELNLENPIFKPAPSAVSPAQVMTRLPVSSIGSMSTI